MTTDFRLSEVKRWMFEEALPLWADIGQDVPGLGFREQLSLQAQPLDPGFKRTRVQCRQIYVYCHAAELGWNGPARKAAANGMGFLLQHAWLPNGGWATKLSPSGEPIDTILNSYDHAFVLFALGWYYRLTRDPALLEHAHHTLDVMHTRLRHPTGLGFFTTPGFPHMEQDPNMHFMEAMLVLFEATGDRRFADEARSILRLFRDHIHQPGSAVLLEDFDLDWRSPSDPDHRRIEPGHHFEWIWLLWQAKRILGDDLMDLAPPLFAFVDRHGSDTDGLVYDDVLEDGRVVGPGHRTWVMTEALKGYITMNELTDADHSARIAQVTSLILDRYLSTPVRGLWTDQPIGQANNIASASTFYHLFLAFAELQRWAASLG